MEKLNITLALLIFFTNDSVQPNIYVYGKPRGLVVRVSRVRFPVPPWGFFFESEDFHCDCGVGSLVEFKFKAPPGT
jgi:hypothetical protein